MPVSRLPRLTVGDQVGLDGSMFTVTALSGDAVALTDVTGQVCRVPVAAMLADATFTVLTPARAPLPNRGVLDGATGAGDHPGTVVGAARDRGVDRYCLAIRR